jgi:hypothetical protein
MIVHGTKDGYALLACVICEFFEVGQDRFSPGDVEFAVGQDEVVLCIDIPEYDTGHGASVTQ